jgi:ribonuclease HI
MTSFYVVANGKKTGIYNTWNECKEQIEDFPGAIFKKFGTFEEANEFLDNHVNNLYVYTDGSCVNNGKANAKAGYGIYFSKDNPMNVSYELKGDNLTNNIAELSAVIHAINLIKDTKFKNKIIVTDSEYVIKCATTYGFKLSERGWKQKKDKIIPNLELVKELYELSIENHIKYKHIMAHTENKDKHSIGNYWADFLANKAIGVEPEMKNAKIYLNVAYSEKDDAKSKGARWDANKKQWYIYEDNKNKEELLKKYKK